MDVQKFVDNIKALVETMSIIRDAMIKNGYTRQEAVNASIMWFLQSTKPQENSDRRDQK